MNESVLKKVPIYFMMAQSPQKALQLLKGYHKYCKDDNDYVKAGIFEAKRFNI
jgi:hypothetical protein